MGEEMRRPLIYVMYTLQKHGVKEENGFPSYTTIDWDPFNSPVNFTFVVGCATGVDRFNNIIRMNIRPAVREVVMQET